MADWYVSSAAYGAIAAFVPSAVYSIGNIVKPTAPALKAQWAFRCTTAGTASTEPAWPTANNATITTGGATFTNVTGQSAYFWGAAAGDIATIMTTSNRLSGGDRVFISSDHAETQTTTTNYGTGVNGPQSFSPIQYICVNRAGSTPPVAADVTTGATVTVNAGAGLLFIADSTCYYTGIAWVYSGSSQGIRFSGTAQFCLQYFTNCSLWLNNAATITIIPDTPSHVVFDNTTCRFSAAAQTVGTNTSGINHFDFTWLNTPSALVGTTLTTLFRAASAAGMITCRGVDFSAATGNLVISSTNGAKYLFDSCRIAGGVTRYNPSSIFQTQDVVELVNCFDGTSIISERYTPMGTVTTEFAITLTGGATDNVGTFSHKMVSSARAAKFVNTLEGFWMDANYATTGSSKTATVEIVSSASLNNDEISLLLEYEGTASSSLASFASSFPNPLTTPAAITTSTATWNSLPATPVRQHLQVTFTPRTAGRVRAQVRLGKPSTTVYYDPRVVIT